MMRTLRFLALAALLAVPAAQAQQAPTTVWEAGKHYFVIDPPAPTTSGDKIEVTEVFSYGCPACNYSYPYIDKLRKALPANAVMNYVPAAFKPDEDWPMFQRAYFAAKALGVAEKSHDAMFDAVWKTDELATFDKTTNRYKQPQPTIEQAAKFYEKYGVKAEDFVATATSFTISTRMRQADAWIKTAGVDVTPTIIVNGKYRLSSATVGGGWDKIEELVLYLVKKESGSH